MINSLVLDFCFADTVKSFENVTSDFNNACYQSKKQNKAVKPSVQCHSDAKESVSEELGDWAVIV